jgi:phage terminase small subunit
MLSMAYHQYFEAVRNGAKEGFLNIYANDKGNTIQINGHQAQLNQAYANILKHSSKFGMNAADREKISAFSEKKADLPVIE